MQKRVAPASFARCAASTHFRHVQQRFALEARVVAHALRAVRAVLRTRAGLDREQRAHLHRARLVMRADARAARGTAAPRTASRTAIRLRRASSRDGWRRDRVWSMCISRCLPRKCAAAARVAPRHADRPRTCSGPLRPLSTEKAQFHVDNCEERSRAVLSRVAAAAHVLPVWRARPSLPISTCARRVHHASSHECAGRWRVPVVCAAL